MTPPSRSNAPRPHRHFSIDIPPRFCEECGKDWKAVMDGRAGRKQRKVGSVAEETLAVQLDQAKIPYEREYRFHPSRKWRADFTVRTALTPVLDVTPGIWPILVEIDGGGYIAGRHSRGAGIEKDCEKASAAAILGYRVIRCTPAQVNDGRALSWIRQALNIEQEDAA